jgi:hypothetical protein
MVNLDLPAETREGLHKTVLPCSEVRRQISVKLNHLIFYDNQLNASGVFECCISRGLPSDET